METTGLNRIAHPVFWRICRSLAAGIALAPLAAAATAQWPAENVVKIVVPFAAGGATDLLARSLATELGRRWKQTVIVENKAGAGGSVGAQAVAKAAADGYTLLLASASMFTVNQHIYSKLPYSIENFEPVTKVASGPMVVTVNADLPVKTTAELVAYAKANPGKIQFASAGIGSQTHIAAEAFADASGIELLHVPYKGDGPAYSDLMAGVVQLALGNINAISPLLKGQRLRALSVTGRERSALLASVPTTAEDGVPGFEFVSWFALMAPAGTPQQIVSRIYADVKLTLDQPQLRRYLEEHGMAAAMSPPGTLPGEIAKESLRWKALVARKNISTN